MMHINSTVTDILLGYVDSDASERQKAGACFRLCPVAPALRVKAALLILTVVCVVLGVTPELRSVVASRAQAAGPDGFTWVESWRHATAEPVDAVAVGDVTGDGAPNLVALVGETVTVYALDAQGPHYTSTIGGFAERPTSVHVYDYDGDGQSDVWIGTEAPGLIYIYSYDPKTQAFARRERISYAWNDVVQLTPLNLDGWGNADLAALTRGNGLAVFRWTSKGYEEVRTGEFGRDVQFLDVADVSGNSRDDLVIARGADQVVMLQWESDPEVAAAKRSWEEYNRGLQDAMGDRGAAHGDARRRGMRVRMRAEPRPTDLDMGRGLLTKAWENFVWGTHTHLFVDRFRGSKEAEIVVLSSQRIAKIFGVGADGSIQLIRAPDDWPQLTGNLIASADLDADGEAELVEATPDGIAVWSVLPGLSQAFVLPTSNRPVATVHLASGRVSLIIAGRWGFALLEARDSDYVRVLRGGARHELTHPPLVEKGAVYLSGEDWTQLTGMTLRWDAGSRRITGIRGFHFLVGQLGDTSWVYDGRLRGLSFPPLAKGDLLYLESGFGRMIGVDVTWEGYSRTLVVEP